MADFMLVAEFPDGERHLIRCHSLASAPLRCPECARLLDVLFECPALWAGVLCPDCATSERNFLDASA